LWRKEKHENIFSLKNLSKLRKTKKEGKNWKEKERKGITRRTLREKLTWFSWFSYLMFSENVIQIKSWAEITRKEKIKKTKHTHTQTHAATQKHTPINIELHVNV